MLYLTFGGVRNLKPCRICTSIFCDCHQNNNKYSYFSSARNFCHTTI